MAPSILDTVCDELNSALDDAEEVFASRFRVASEVPMAECFLRFAKQGKDYGFFLVSKDGHFPKARAFIYAVATVHVDMHRNFDLYRLIGLAFADPFFKDYLR